MEKVGKDDLLLVISDHGFTSFRRGVNLNSWLLDKGLLHLKEGTDGSAEWLRDVDWSRTKAYSLGLTGMFLNLEGREAEGIVKPGEEAEAVKQEIIAGLNGLRDEEKDEIGINEAFDTAALYQGPYLRNAPDLLIGYNHGYRVSWDCATGMVDGPVFEDNLKAWSGDHGVDPRIVPGVIFANREIHDDDPALMDIAPTALSLFGIEPPKHMDGKPIYDRARFENDDPTQGGTGSDGRTAMRPRSRWIGVLVLVGLLAPVLQACAGPAAADDERKVIVIGIDGMDWGLTERLMAEGQLPNLSKLAAEGSARPLGTSVPPLSPVAWSDFITGTDSGGHGIFDFIHRHPDSLSPYLSTSEPERAGLATKLPFLPEVIPMGKYCLPLASEEQVLLRYGTPFWEVLEEGGVETTVIRMPANFPVTGTATRELSGMGTPDILGTYGTFTFYTTDVFTERKTVGGGQVVPMDLWDDIARGKIFGPPDSMLCDAPELEVDFRVYLDSDEPVAKIEIDDARAIVEVGEWSPWMPVSFDLTASGSLPGIVRFFLKQLEPEVELYATPVNIDPMSPAQPISHPDDYAAELAEATGLFYTQGMPEDTRAFSEGYLSRDEFLEQARIAGEENVTQFRHVLDGFENGLLFYYFGNLDQISHMMWGTMDPEHPSFIEEEDAPYADFVPSLYRKADEVVGHAMSAIDDNTTLLVMSDHGFASWRRSFHLNAWLAENGYVTPRSDDRDPGALLNVDWSRTRAYGLGFNGLYVNLSGREKNGIVSESEKQALLEEIRDRLLEATDPETGEPAITKVYLAGEHFTGRGKLEIGPDLLVGYAKGTRGHSNSAIGQITGDPILSDNTDEWTGDHGMDHETVPGVLFINRPLKRPAESLRDLAASVLAEFGIEGFPPVSV